MPVNRTIRRAVSVSEPVPAAADNVLSHDDEEAITQDEPVAKVIPLGVFDPFKEADKRW